MYPISDGTRNYENIMVLFACWEILKKQKILKKWFFIFYCVMKNMKKNSNIIKNS